jgi:hypothetical protein
MHSNPLSSGRYGGDCAVIVLATHRPNGQGRIKHQDPSEGHAPAPGANVSVVGVVVVVPGQAEPWKVSNAAFRLLAEAASKLTADPADRVALIQAAANHGLFFDQMEVEARARMAALVAQAARSLRAQLLSRRPSDVWSMELAAYLPVLEMWLEGLLEGTATRRTGDRP